MVALGLALAACRAPVTDGDQLAKEHRWTEAVASYKKALADYPYDYDAAWGIAKIYCYETHFADKCVAWTDKLLEIYPYREEFRAAARVGLRELAVKGERNAEAKLRRLERD